MKPLNKEITQRCFVNAPWQTLKTEYLDFFIEHRIQPEIGLEGTCLYDEDPNEFRRIAEILQKHKLDCTLHAPFLIWLPVPWTLISWQPVAKNYGVPSGFLKSFDRALLSVISSLRKINKDTNQESGQLPPLPPGKKLCKRPPNIMCRSCLKIPMRNRLPPIRLF